MASKAKHRYGHMGFDPQVPVAVALQNRVETQRQARKHHDSTGEYATHDIRVWPAWLPTTIEHEVNA